MSEEIIVKLSYPKWWDDQWGGPMYLYETANREGKVGNFRFDVNSDSADCDIWIIYDNHSGYLFDVANCNYGYCIFVTGEVNDTWHYPQKFLDQFDAVVTARQDISHKNLIKSQHLCVWHVKKDIDYLLNLKPFEKPGLLSTVTSMASKTALHKQRVDFIKHLQGAGLPVDWYGKGVNEISDKWEGLSPYKYSIAIENSCHQGYFTEKIIDCFLSFAVPIYHGCPNILDYFPEKSMILIDPYRIEYSMSRINEAIQGDYYEKNFEALVEARNLVLSRYGFFPALCETLAKTCDLRRRRPAKRIILSNPMLQGKLTLKQRLYRKKEMMQKYMKGYR